LAWPITFTVRHADAAVSLVGLIRHVVRGTHLGPGLVGGRMRCDFSTCFFQVFFLAQVLRCGRGLGLKHECTHNKRIFGLVTVKENINFGPLGNRLV